MITAVLSGKGGTGKTLVSVNLASAAGDSIYIDCDVEEPNGHLFFKPTQVTEKEITVKLPLVDMELCDGCKKCVEFCKFNALAYVNKKLVVFDEVCHSCGGCMLVCPQKALTERDKPIGKVMRGKSGEVKVITGMLNTGEASGIPIIKDMLEDISENKEKDIFIDCPPGSACIVMESIKDADYCVLVAEPTIFGAHNLQMVHELVTLFNKKFGVVLNKSLGGEDPSRRFCEENNVDIIGEIPFDKKLGSMNSDGKIAVRQDAGYKRLFEGLLKTVRREAKK